MDPSRGKNTNCLNDEARFLDIFKSDEWRKLKKLLPCDAPVPTPAVEEQPCSELVPIDQLQGLENYDPKENPGDVKYSSYLSRRIILSTSKCEMCTEAFSVEKENREEQHDILALIENPASEYALFSSRVELQHLVHKAVVNFVATLRKYYAHRSLGQKLTETISLTHGFHILSKCSLHSDQNMKIFVKIMKSSLLRLLLRDENSWLKKRLKESTGKAKVGSLAASSKQPIKLFYGDMYNKPAPAVSSK
jgi:hypothetical protein